MFGMIGSIIGAGISAAGQVEANKDTIEYNKWAQNDQQNFNSKEAQLARDWQEEFYNTYQSPSAMIQQYKDAGLNPALAYQGGTNTPPSSSAASSGLSSVSLQNPLSGFSNLGAEIRDMFRLKNETKAMEFENKVRESQAKAYAAKALLDGQTVELQKKQLSEIDKKIEQIGKDMELTDEQIKIAQQTLTSIKYDNSIKSYQISLNTQYKQLSDKLDLPIPMTEKLASALAFSIGSLAGNLLSPVTGFLKSLIPKGSKKQPLFKQPSLKMTSDGRSAYAPGSTVVWE